MSSSLPKQSERSSVPSPTPSGSKCRIINGILHKSPSLPLVRLTAREQIVPEIGHARLVKCVRRLVSVTAALRDQPQRPNPVKLESLGAMMRAAAAAI
jgi:hypothetical protein